MVHGSMYAYRRSGFCIHFAATGGTELECRFWVTLFCQCKLEPVHFRQDKEWGKTGTVQRKRLPLQILNRIFQLQVKNECAAYLNLLASQRLQFVQEKPRTGTGIFEMTDSRAKSGLIPEVDASLAKAEVSNAKSLQIKSYDKVLEYSKQLARILGWRISDHQLDSLYSTTIPKKIYSALK